MAVFTWETPATVRFRIHDAGYPQSQPEGLWDSWIRGLSVHAGKLETWVLTSLRDGSACGSGCSLVHGLRDWKEEFTTEM